MIPDDCGGRGGIEYLESILPGVTSSRQQHRDSLDAEFLDLISGRQVSEPSEQFGRSRALHRQSGKMLAEVGDRNFAHLTRLHPAKVLFDLRSVYHEKIVVAATAVDDQIVNHTALLI